MPIGGGRSYRFTSQQRVKKAGHMYLARLF